MSRNRKGKLTREPQVSQGAILRHTQVQISGPLPPPQVLEEYNRISPGAADRIISMAENEQKFSHDTTHAAIQEERESARRGQNLGIVCVLSAFVTAIILAALQAYAAASILLGTTVAALAAVFVTGRIIKPRKDE